MTYVTIVSKQAFENSFDAVSCQVKIQGPHFLPCAFSLSLKSKCKGPPIQHQSSQSICRIDNLLNKFK
jgi:hypothetical protein